VAWPATSCEVIVSVAGVLPVQRTPLSLNPHRCHGFALLALVLVVALSCEGAAGTDGRSAAANLIVDDFGDTLELRAYERIVSLNPTTTEAIFAMEAQSLLVGRSTWDTWPAEARSVPDVGPALRPNVEQVMAARPDLVLLYASADNREAARQLRSARIATAAFRVDSISHFMRVMRLLGQLTGDPARGASIADSVARSLAAIRDATRSAARPSVLLPSWYSPLIVIGAGSHLNELVEIAGGRNVYGDIADPSPQVAFEDVVLRDPDVILVTPGGRRRILADPRWRSLSAVRMQRVVELDTNVVGRPSVTLGAAAANIARLLHPGLTLP
jgi:iron complex transport system substrate-binding protein